MRSALNTRSGLGLILYINLFTYGCSLVPPSVKDQCQSLYQASKNFRDYKEEASAVNQGVFQKYFPESLSQDNQISQAELLKKTMAISKNLEKDKYKIHAEQSIEHKKFSSELYKKHKKIKNLNITEKELKSVQHSFHNFYKGRGKYHNLQSKLFKKMSKMKNRFDLSEPKTQALNKEINTLHDWVNSNSVQDLNSKSFIKLKKYCNISGEHK